MRNSSDMLIGNIDKFKGHGFVAFLDILGFSKEIQANWNNIDNNPLDKILELKDNLPIHTDAELNNVKNESKTSRRYVCRVQTISDSIVVSFGFDEKPIYGDMILGTIAFFDTISVIWRNALEVGFTLRGAADFGNIYWNEKEIIGPSFITAYQLEQTHAKTSRIIISSSFNRNIEKMFFQGKTFWNDDILRILRKDIDGLIILNPHTLYSTDEEKEHVIKLITDLRDNAGTNKEKYSPLLGCLNVEKHNLKSEDLGKY